jgi:rod shape-determining protein MreC
MVKKNGAFGSLEWNGDNPRVSSLLHVNKHVPVEIGDEIVTNNYSTLFPVGIPIGTIKEKTLEAEDNFYALDVALFTDFNTLKTVYVIRNILKDEQKNLENNLKGDH